MISKVDCFWKMMCLLSVVLLSSLSKQSAFADPPTPSANQLKFECVSRAADNGTGLCWSTVFPKDMDVIDPSKIIVHINDSDVQKSVEESIGSSDNNCLSDFIQTLIDGADFIGKPIKLDSIRLVVTVGSVQKTVTNDAAQLRPENFGVTRSDVRCQITLTFAVSVPPAKTMKIVISTQSAKANPSSVLSKSTTLGEVNGTMGSNVLTLTDTEKDILIEMRGTEQDRQVTPLTGAPETISQEELFQALGRAGWLVFRAAGKRNIKLGGDFPPVSDIETLKLDLPNIFAVPGEGGTRSKMKANIIASQEMGDLIFSVEGIPLVSGIGMSSLPYVLENDDSYHLRGQTAIKVAQKREARLRDLAGNYRDRLNALGRMLIPTVDDWKSTITKLREDIFKDAKVFRVDTAVKIDTPSGYRVVLPVQLKEPPIWEEKAGGSYNVEDGLTADASLKGANLLNQTAQVGLTFKAGSNAQKGTLSGQLTHVLNAKTRAIFNLDGRLFRDPDQLLGQSVPSGVEEQESGIRLKFGLHQDSNGFNNAEELSKPNRIRAVTGLDLILDYRNLNLKARGITPNPLQDGVLSTAGLVFTQAYSLPMVRSASYGIRRVDLQFTANAERGTSLLGGKYRYGQFQTNLQATVYLGRMAAKNDIFLRYTQGIGTISGGAPLFRQFRLGGVETIAGLENGEVVAPRIGFRQLELGIPLSLPGFEASAKGSNAFAKVFYHSALAGAGQSIVNLAFARANLDSYGLGLELRQPDQNAAITIGYAFSPNSQKHRSGTFVVGVSLFYGN
jgi:hypothetical protein